MKIHIIKMLSMEDKIYFPSNYVTLNVLVL